MKDLRNAHVSSVVVAKATLHGEEVVGRSQVLFGRWMDRLLSQARR